MRKINFLLIILTGTFLGSCQTQSKEGTGGANQVPVKLIRVEVPGKPDRQLERIVSVFIRQLEKRCSAKVTTQGEAPLAVVLTIDSSIGTIRILGGDAAKERQV